MGLLQEISGLVKQAVTFSGDGRSFVLGKGENPTVAAREWLRMHPQMGSSVHRLAKQILSSNPSVGQGAFRPGRAYMMPQAQSSTGQDRTYVRGTGSPSSTIGVGGRESGANVGTRSNGRAYPYRLNNPGNMEYSSKNPWPGQVGRGGTRGRFARYDTPMHGLEASIGRWMEIIRSRASRGENTRIPDVVRVYSPASDGNDERRHSSNIASRSGISAEDILDADNIGQMADLSLGIAGAESGRRAQDFFTRQDSTNAVNNISPVVLRRIAR